MSRCKCRDCDARRAERYEYRHGGTDWETDYDEPVKYKKPSRNTWAGKKKRPCKRSKTGEQCKYTVWKVIGTIRVKNTVTDTWYYKPNRILTCERCGKYNWGTYNWTYLI